MYIGQVEGRRCLVSEKAPNYSVIITGVSGSGKSCRQNKIELEAVKNGNTVIVLDVSQNHRKKDVLEEIRNEYVANVNSIDVEECGLGLNMLSPIQKEDGKIESGLGFISGCVKTLSVAQNMGTRQKAVLREVICEAVTVKQMSGCTDEEALKYVFGMNREDARWAEIYEKLWMLIHSGVLGACNKTVKAGRINVISFGNLDVKFSEYLAQLLLESLWRWVNVRNFSQEFGRVIVVIDEFQNMDLGKNSVLRNILREGRKFGLNLLLTTQTLQAFSTEERAMLSQAATHLYFKPSETEITKCARAINPENVKKYREMLETLRVGECIAVGEKEIDGVRISRPLKLR